MQNRRNAVRPLLSAVLCAAVFGALPAPGLRAQPAADLDDVVVYPNPFRPAADHAAITFANVTGTGVRLRVFKITGELVADVEPDTAGGSFVWGVVDDAGEKVASGVYVYLLTDDDGNKMQGKIAIVR